MGCIVSKQASSHIHPNESFKENNNSKRQSENIVAEKDQEWKKGKEEETKTEGFDLKSSPGKDNPVRSGSVGEGTGARADTDMATKRDESTRGVTPEGNLPELERTTEGHLIPQPVPKCDRGEDFITTLEMYNLLNDGQRAPYLHDPSYMLVLDARDRDTFGQGHITTARHSSAVDTEFDCLLSQGKLDRFTIVVAYDHASSSGVVDPTLASFVQRLKQVNVDVQILSGGYRSFRETYPFLCDDLTIRSEKDRMINFKSYPSEILEGTLYQGNVKHAIDDRILRNLGITHVLNVSKECKNAFELYFQYLQVRVEDESTEQLGPHLRKAADFVTDAIRGGGRVFIHCVQGKSRSSTCTIAFLMAHKGWTLKDAHEFLKDRRSIAAPNRGFLLQLSKFEQSLFGKVISSVDDIYF